MEMPVLTIATASQVSEIYEVDIRYRLFEQQRSPFLNNVRTNNSPLASAMAQDRHPWCLSDSVHNLGPFPPVKSWDSRLLAEIKIFEFLRGKP